MAFAKNSSKIEELWYVYMPSEGTKPEQLSTIFVCKKALPFQPCFVQQQTAKIFVNPSSSPMRTYLKKNYTQVEGWPLFSMPLKNNDVQWQKNTKVSKKRRKKKPSMNFIGLTLSHSKYDDKREIEIWDEKTEKVSVFIYHNHGSLFKSCYLSLLQSFKKFIAEDFVKMQV